MISRRASWTLVAILFVACTATDDPDATDGPEPLAIGRGSLAPPVEIETAPPPPGGWLEAACALPPEQVERVARGYYPERSHDLMVVPRAPNFFGSFTGQTHSGPWDYLQRVPLVFYGPGFIRAQGNLTTSFEPTSADIAPTFAELLGSEPVGGEDSTVLKEALVPEARRPEPPRLIVTVVWDGGGRDVLNQWQDEWPNLARIVEEGTSFEDAVVGSSPSVTPAVHATIGTGVFPEEHGVVDIRQRMNGEIVASWARNSPDDLLVPTLADTYDQEVGNSAEIGVLGDHSWHFGMVGHGSYLEGGDRDIAVITRLNGAVSTNVRYYELPGYIEEVDGFEEDLHTIDASDGEVNSRWLGNDLNDLRLARETPVATLYQSRLIEAILTNESFGRDEIPDLFFTNYKQIDYAGHRFNLVEPEMREAVRYSDQELGELVEFLNEWVGEKRWVLALTADHGTTPYAAVTGAWPIRIGELEDDLAAHFGVPKDEIVHAPRATGFWLNREGLAANDITAEEVADAMLDMRARDNALPVDELPPGYEERLDERIFSAVWPSSRMDDVLACTQTDR